MAGKYHTAVLVYFLCFAIASGFFLRGHHVVALVVVLTAWAGIAA